MIIINHFINFCLIICFTSYYVTKCWLAVIEKYVLKINNLLISF